MPGMVSGAGLLVTLRPAPHLPLHVALGSAQIPQARFLIVQAMQLDQGLEGRLANPPHALGGQARWGLGAQNHPVQALHHIKRSPQHAFVGTVQQGLGHLGVYRLEG